MPLCFSYSYICYQEEKNGFLQWTVWVKELLRWTIRPWVPPRLCSTITQGICTSWTGLFPSLKAWVRFKTCEERFSPSQKKIKTFSSLTLPNHLFIISFYCIRLCPIEIAMRSNCYKYISYGCILYKCTKLNNFANW